MDSAMDPEPFLDELESSSDVKINDRKAFMTALRGLVNCCNGEDDGEEEDQGKGKGMPSVALILGKKR